MELATLTKKIYISIILAEPTWNAFTRSVCWGL